MKACVSSFLSFLRTSTTHQEQLCNDATNAHSFRRSWSSASIEFGKKATQLVTPCKTCKESKRIAQGKENLQMSSVSVAKLEKRKRKGEGEEEEKGEEENMKFLFLLFIRSPVSWRIFLLLLSSFFFFFFTFGWTHDAMDYSEIDTNDVFRRLCVCVFSQVK